MYVQQKSYVLKARSKCIVVIKRVFYSIGRAIVIISFCLRIDNSENDIIRGWKI